MLILALELLEVLISAIEDRGLAVGLGLALLGQERRAGRHRRNGGRKLKLCLDSAWTTNLEPKWLAAKGGLSKGLFGVFRV